MSRLRPCLDCNRPTPAGRCGTCSSNRETLRDRTADRERERRRNRDTSTDRGYGAAHQRERAAWAPLVATGTIECRRAPSGQCVAPTPTIHPDEPWHLGHPDTACPAPKAPEHVRCNAGAPRRGLKNPAQGEPDPRGYP